MGYRGDTIEDLLEQFPDLTREDLLACIDFLLVRTGNIGTRDLIAIFENRLAEIVPALDANTLVEIERVSMHTAP